MKYCSNFKYDLEVGQAAEKEIGEMLSKKKIENKRYACQEDRKCIC